MVALKLGTADVGSRLGAGVNKLYLGPTLIYPTAASTLYVNDFSQYTVGQAPPDWTSRWTQSGFTSLVQNVAGSLSGRALRWTKTGTGDKALSWDASPVSSDVEILARYRAIESTLTGEVPIFIWSRGSGNLTTKTGYVSGVYPNNSVHNTYIVSLSNGEGSVLQNVTGLTGVSLNAWTWIRVRTQGTQHYTKSWSSGSPEPVAWTTQVTTSLVQGLGFVGLFANNTNPNTEIDYFAVDIAAATIPLPVIAQPPATASPTIAVTSGGGYAGSTYTATPGDGSTRWYADGVDTGFTGATYTMRLVDEGKAIQAGPSPAALSNAIEMWVPTDASNLSLMADIRQGLTLVSGGVETWASQTGGVAGTQATAANRMTHSTTSFNSAPGLTCDGNDWLGGLNIVAGGTGPTARSYFGAAQFANASDNRTILGGSGSRPWGIRRNTARQMQVIVSGINTLASDTVAVPDNTPMLLGLQWTIGAEVKFRQNGAVTTTVAQGGGDQPFDGPMQIGRALTSGYMVGVLSSQLLYERVVTDAEALNAEGWLAHTTGQAARLVANHPYKAAGPRVQ